MVSATTTKHTATPGPWTATLVMGPVSVPREERTEPSHYLIGEDGRGKPAHLANIAHVIGANAKSEANARLIAAAPGMLAALQLVSYDRSVRGGITEATWTAVRAAIAEAVSE